MAGWADQLEALNQACRTQFGEPVLYRASDGREFSITAVFDDRYSLADPGTPGLSTTTPMVNLRLADLPVDPGEDDGEFECRGVRYRVTDFKPDAAGWAIIPLHKVAA